MEAFELTVVILKAKWARRQEALDLGGKKIKKQDRLEIQLFASKSFSVNCLNVMTYSQQGKICQGFYRTEITVFSRM